MNKRLLFSTLSMSLISGFVFAQQPDGQTQLENRFDQFLSKENIGHSIKELSAKPHHLGSEAGKEVALKLNDLFKSYGWNSQIETFYVLFPTPVERKLELLLPVKFSATLKEPAVPGDATSGQQGQLPTYNVWGADGDVTAPLVFVNYGLPADYRELASRGIDVKGKIVIAKYGNSWRELSQR